MPTHYPTLLHNIKRWATDLGFQQLGVADVHLDEAQTHLLNWLNQGRHGEMEYMARHGTKRTHPEELIPGTIRIISVRMDYWPDGSADPWQVIENPNLAYISRYALGRDYHKLMRARLAELADKIQTEIGPFGYRAFVDSAPVMEKALAEKSGLGWIGKHTNLLSRNAGSWFFLGELYVDIPLPVDEPTSPHCGSCQACIDICPTQAIVGPYQVDARRCISYLTIELKGAIPLEFRPLIGNRIYGCDDCQLVCPWNRFAQGTREPDFAIRHQLDQPTLLDLFAWDETTFLKRTEGSPIRRIGHERWLRNIAVALGNAPPDASVLAALKAQSNHPSEIVREHVAWAIDRQLAAPPL